LSSLLPAAAFVALATVSGCGGKVVLDATASGEGGAGAGPGIVLSNGPAPNVNNTSSCDPAYTCAEAVASGGDPALLCHTGKEAQFFVGLVWCACKATCAAACSSACAGAMTGSVCIECLNADCAVELAACCGLATCEEGVH
jgi:hypothetical protein